MIYLVLLCALGLAAGFMLLVRAPLCSAGAAAITPKCSVIIPARNEERNLPRLLNSLRDAWLAHEIIVVDDASMDGTAAVAAAHGAAVHASSPLPAAWTGKTWACFQGAEMATGDVLVFLDADTWFEPGGFEKVMGFYAAEEGEVALSVLPSHMMRRPYESLSLFFNLLMAFGAGGFGFFGGQRLFGPSLVISRKLYEAIGGHAAVRRHILENVALSGLVEEAGARCVCIAGRGTLNVRMFPEGFHQLWEGWMKAFANGAAATDSRVLVLAVYWLTALSTTFLLLFAAGPARVATVILYVAFALQTWWFARQLGNFRLAACLLYPIPLSFFFVLFTGSFLRRSFKRQVTWRGRQL
jgi:4,4'-diaponeurosporenoate glycosyltransferase